MYWFTCPIAVGLCSAVAILIHVVESEKRLSGEFLFYDSKFSCGVLSSWRNILVPFIMVFQQNDICQGRIYLLMILDSALEYPGF